MTMRIVFALGIILSLLNILMADTELQFSSAEKVILFVILCEFKKTLYFLFVLVQILLKRIFEYFENFFAIGKYTVFICLSRFECNAL